MGLKPTTVKGYLDALPEERRRALAAVRTAIRKHLPPGYKEGLQYGMIGYYVPHSLYPPGYHCDPKQPLPFLSLAAQKNFMAVYMFCLYTDEKARDAFVREWKATGKKLDMGKSCVRFRRLDDVPLDVLGRAIAKVPVESFVEAYEAGLASAGTRHPGRAGEPPAPKKQAAKPSEAAKPATPKKPAPAKPQSKKPATRKAPAKKAAAKRPAAKKATARKPGRKKPT